MAGEAIVIKIPALVIRIIRLDKVAGMTGKALWRSVGISTRVTRLAIKADVPAFERKSRKCVIVTPWINRHPPCGSMTASTIMAKSIRYMIRIGCSRKRHLMARVAVVDRIDVSRTVARLALQFKMCAIDSKTCLIVIKFRRLPGGSSMALLTIMAEVRRLVVWVIGSGKSAAMTRVAV